MKSVYWAVRTGSLTKAVCASYLKGVCSNSCPKAQNCLLFLDGNVQRQLEAPGLDIFHLKKEKEGEKKKKKKKKKKQAAACISGVQHSRSTLMCTMLLQSD